MFRSRLWVILFSFALVWMPVAPVSADTKSWDSHDVESFILYVLHDEIQKALREKYHTDQFIQNDCARVTEFVKQPLASGSPRLEDGWYFVVSLELKVINRVDGDELVKLTFNTDPSVGIKLIRFERGNFPSNYPCQKINP